MAFSQSTVPVRQNWQTFKLTPQYRSFVEAFRLMRNNVNPDDPNSLNYWANIHVDACPHKTHYFLAWHRGFLAHFERQLQIVSKDPALFIPYWDYYAWAKMPWEFVNSPSTNPLYRDRSNTDVSAALSLAPFSDLITSFPRYWSSNPFETSVESAPHNTFHSIVGGVMWTMNAPLDPIFWLHHCYIDRLWSAWIAAGGGRRVPVTTSSYWSGQHVYRPDLDTDRLATRSEVSLNYTYQSMAMPKSMPASTTTARAPGSSSELLLASSPPRSIRALLHAGGASSVGAGGFIRTGGRQADMNVLAQGQWSDIVETGAVLQTAPVRPPIGRFRETGRRKTAPGKLALGGVAEITLDETSISAEIPLTQADRLLLKEIAGKAQAVTVNGPPAPSDDYQSARIVLDHVRLTPVGQTGGYFYNVFLNLPTSPGTGVPKQKLLIGNFGPFDVAGAKHHGDMSQLTFDITHMIDQVNLANLDKVRISFVRVSGENTPSGRVIQLGEARVEVSESLE